MKEVDPLRHRKASRTHDGDLKRPTTLPSGSANCAKVTTSGISVTGTAVLPPSDSHPIEVRLRIIDLDVEGDLVKSLGFPDAANATWARTGRTPWPGSNMWLTIVERRSNDEHRSPPHSSPRIGPHRLFSRGGIRLFTTRMGEWWPLDKASYGGNRAKDILLEPRATSSRLALSSRASRRGASRSPGQRQTGRAKPRCR
jgi:hypothetical protein